MKDVKWTLGTLALAVAMGLLLAGGAWAQDETTKPEKKRDQEKVQAQDRDREHKPEMGPGRMMGPDGKFGVMAFEIMKEKLQLTDEQVATLRPLHEALVNAGKAYWDALQSTLTSAQKENAKGIIGQAIQERMGPGDAMRHARFGALKDLDLTAEQQEKIKGVFKDVREQMQAIFPKFKENPEEARKEMETVQQGVDARIQEILTPEQFEQYQARIQETGKKFKMRHGAGEGQAEVDDQPGRHRRVDETGE